MNGTLPVVNMAMYKAACEYISDGRLLHDEPSAVGEGQVQVTAHEASADRPASAEPGEEALVEEWRVLRFVVPGPQPTKFIQSIARVRIAPAGAAEPLVQQRTDSLPLLYAQSFVAVTLATLHLLGAPVISRDAGRQLRILCVGLGGGPVATWLAAAVPSCLVDVVELDAEVVRAARGAMGFVEGARLRAHIGDGAAFARDAATAAASDPGAGSGAYDAVLVDVADGAGRVPDAFVSQDGDLATALSLGLLPNGCRPGVIAGNFQPKTDADSLLAAWRAATPQAGVSFSVREPDLSIDGASAPGSGNLLAVLTSGEAAMALLASDGLPARLRKAAREVQQAAPNCTFDLESLAAHRLCLLSPS